MAGDCPDFAESSEQNGTVPLSEAVLLDAFILPAAGRLGNEPLRRADVPAIAYADCF